MLVDLHLHTTRYSTGCSILEPRKVPGRLLSLGLEGAAITEHNYLWTPEELARLRAETGAGGLFLVSGQEVESEIGHLLLFGYTGPLEARLPFEQILARVHEAGGIVIWAHPLRYGRYDQVPDERIVELARACDGLEALTPSHSPSENDRALALARTYQLTATGGSDAHSLEAVGRCLTRFEKPLFSMPDLIAAVKAGACRPESGPAPPPD